MTFRDASALPALLTLLGVGCMGDDDGKKKAAEPLPPVTIVQPTDAGAEPATLDAAGVTQLPSYDPASGFHLDDAPATRPATRLPPREKKVAQIILRSTPTGALAAVDGVRLGPTPVLWEGLIDGHAHEFTFSLAGHALARYRFVPVTGGIVHGTLVKVTDDRDAGTPEIPQVARPAPTAPSAPAPAPPAPPTPTTDAPLPPSAELDAGVTGAGPPM